MYHVSPGTDGCAAMSISALRDQLGVRAVEAGDDELDARDTRPAPRTEGLDVRERRPLQDVVRPGGTLLGLLSTASGGRPRPQPRAMEPRLASAPVPAPPPAEVHGAARSPGGVAVATVAGGAGCSATCSATSISEISNDSEPLARFERATYGLRNRISQENSSEFSRCFGASPGPAEDPCTSSYIFVQEPDRIALGLLEAQTGWISTHDRVRLRRALLGILASLDE
jgi:hypothetical protein